MFLTLILIINIPHDIWIVENIFVNNYTLYECTCHCITHSVTAHPDDGQARPNHVGATNWENIYNLCILLVFINEFDVSVCYDACDTMQRRCLLHYCILDHNSDVSWPAEGLVTSQKGFCSTKLVMCVCVREINLIVMLSVTIYHSLRRSHIYTVGEIIQLGVNQSTGRKS
jgi:hypothetical protein